MKRYFWMLFNQGSPDSMVADVVDLKGTDATDLCIGRRYEHWDDHANVSVGPSGRNGPPDDVLQTGEPLPIFSARLRRALSQADIDQDLQYLPINVFGIGSAAGPFAVANVLSLIPALDTVTSELTRYPADYFIESRRGRISSLRRPVLHAVRALGDAHIFRLEEFWPPVFVSERFHDVFRLGRFTGASFRPMDITGSVK